MPTVADQWAREDLEALSKQGLRRALEPLSSAQGPEVVVGGQRLVNFSSNDYLGLASDPRLARAATEALQSRGVGAGASRLVVGDTEAHHALENAAAALMGAEAARLFNSGYAANAGILQALCGGPEDAVFSDALNHASLVDGCRLSRAKVVVYPHADARALERLLAAEGGRRKVVCTDAVFSMDGDHAPLRELAEACGRHRAALVVDEAHAVGVLGPTGGGLCEALGVVADVRMTTLGKALGAFGAVAVGSTQVVELLMNRARTFVFSTALPAAVCAAGEEAIAVMRAEPARRETLWRNIRRMAEGLRALGVPAEARSAIFPLVLGEPERALEVAAQLRARGVLAKAIRPPTVPKGTSRLRFAVTAAHSEAQIDRALEALAALEVRVAA
ncbi:MAG TPA: 8-amino-7-oxononanoate synthase [Myxococcaceae bacterium]|nr:8-amino-7-oxononanoate synthase [Myxococcaceae bacterium]